MFGEDDDDDEFLEEYDYRDLQRDPNHASSGSKNDKLKPLQLLYKRRRNKKRTERKPYLGRKRGSKRKYKKGDHGNRIAVTLPRGHRGHKRIKSEEPCLPEKHSTCLNVNESVISSLTHLNCDFEKDFCVDDCDCPGFQKCCINTCGRRECLPSFFKPTPTTPAPVAPESGSAVKPEEPTQPLEKKPTTGSEVTGPALESVTALPPPAPVPIPAVHFY